MFQALSGNEKYWQMNNDINQPQGSQPTGGVGLPPLPSIPPMPESGQAEIPTAPPPTPPEPVIPSPLPTLPEVPAPPTPEKPVKPKRKISKKLAIGGTLVLLLIGGAIALAAQLGLFRGDLRQRASGGCPSGQHNECKTCYYSKYDKVGYSCCSCVADSVPASTSAPQPPPAQSQPTAPPPTQPPSGCPNGGISCGSINCPDGTTSFGSDPCYAGGSCESRATNACVGHQVGGTTGTPAPTATAAPGTGGGGGGGCDGSLSASVCKGKNPGPIDTNGDGTTDGICTVTTGNNCAFDWTTGTCVNNGEAPSAGKPCCSGVQSGGKCTAAGTGGTPTATPTVAATPGTGGTTCIPGDCKSFPLPRGSVYRQCNTSGTAYEGTYGTSSCSGNVPGGSCTGNTSGRSGTCSADRQGCGTSGYVEEPAAQCSISSVCCVASGGTGGATCTPGDCKSFSLPHGSVYRKCNAGGTAYEGSYGTSACGTSGPTPTGTATCTCDYCQKIGSSGPATCTGGIKQASRSNCASSASLCAATPTPPAVGAPPAGGGEPPAGGGAPPAGGGEPPGSGTPPTGTVPPGGVAGACVATRLYINGGTSPATAAQIASLQIGNTIRLAVRGNQASFTKGRFVIKLNNSVLTTQETTTKQNLPGDAATFEFIYDYTITQDGNYSIEGSIWQ